jgi:hypothetical protein
MQSGDGLAVRGGGKKCCWVPRCLRGDGVSSWLLNNHRGARVCWPSLHVDRGGGKGSVSGSYWMASGGGASCAMVQVTAQVGSPQEGPGETTGPLSCCHGSRQPLILASTRLDRHSVPERASPHLILPGSVG